MIRSDSAESPISRTALAGLKARLPRGGSLPEDVWQIRHLWISRLLWVNVAGLFLFALSRGFSLTHSFLEAGSLGVIATLATLSVMSRRMKVFLTSIGLLTSSAMLVHLSGGVIESHFHFFVMVAVVALYQDWVPFIAAIAYVLIHHGVVGVLDPRSVYNHAAALAGPWKWAGIHALFITGMSTVCLVTWRLNEQMLDRRKQAEKQLLAETRVVETLNDVARILAAELDLKSLLQMVTDAGTAMTGAQFGAFFHNVVDDSGESYLLYTISGARAEDFEKFPSPRNTAIFAPTFAGEGPVRSDDITKDPRYGKNHPYRGIPEGHLPVRSYLAVPVVSRGKVHGGLFFGHHRVGAFDEYNERFAVGLASHAAVAIDNAQLYEAEINTRHSLEKAKAHLELMAEASKVFFSSLESRTILSGLISVSVPVLAPAGLAVLFDEMGQISLTVASLSSKSRVIEGEASLDLPSGTDGLARALAGNLQTMAVEPASLAALLPTEPDLVTQLSEAHGAMVIVPLAQRGHTQGLLVLLSRENSFPEADLEVAIEMSRRAAIALENAQLYSKQRSVAETLQHSLLLETLPSIPGISASARYLPGGPGVEVGGDWYDLFEVPEGKIAIAMGDVVGRGVPAASLMGQLRNALRAYGLEGSSPCEVLSRLNRALLHLDAGQMATLFYAVLDLETLELTYASAGHPPSIVVHDGRTSLLEVEQGIPLGAMPTAKFSEHHVTMDPNSTLVTYTDGLVEDPETSFETGMGELRATLATCLDDDPATVCNKVLDGPLQRRVRGDDVAILAISPMPAGARFNLDVPVRPGSLRALRAYIRRWLREGGIPTDPAEEVLLAAGEVFSNAIVHSSALSETFSVEGDLNGQIQIKVIDQGRWIDRPSPGSNGRGLDIIGQLMDDLEITRNDESTTVKITRNLQELS